MIIDTNVLLRAWSEDAPEQTRSARAAIASAESIYISTVTLCEFVWVARQNYKVQRSDIAAAIRLLISDPRTVFDRTTVQAGLAFLDAGGDFADGVIEFEGRKLGGTMLLTFDKRAASICRQQGRDCILLQGD